MTYTEEWFGPASCELLARLVTDTEGVEGRIIEVGSWQGRSTVALANAAHPQMVDAVDTWQGSPGEISADLAAGRDVFAEFAANIEERTAGNVTSHRMGWREFFATHEGPIRLLFIDAEHTYQEVRDNILAALPFMAPGSVICGDDAHHPPIIRAVVETIPEAQGEATCWWYRFPPDLSGEYERLCGTPSDIYLHLPRFKALVEELDAQHVIELGTRSGVSTVAWLHALSKTGGTLTSVDIDVRPALPAHPAWTFIQANDLDPDVTGSLEPADIVFIDTSHLYDQTVAELNVYRWLVKPGGRIVCHDTQLERPEGAPARPAYPVRTAILEFVEANNLQWTEHTDCYGLGVIEVPDA